MTIRELSQLYWLKREIQEEQWRLDELMSKATSTVSTNSGDAGRPSGHSDKVGRYASAIADLQSTIGRRLDECVEERRRLEAYIASIDDSLLRQIFTLRFVDGLTWGKVARRIGGGNTSDSVRKQVYRYISKTNHDTADKSRECLDKTTKE